MKRINTSKYKLLLLSAIALLFLGGAGWFINVLLQTEQETQGGPHRVDAIALFTAFCILFLSFLVAHILSRGSFLGRRIPTRIRYIAAIGLLFLIPQSTVLYGRLSQVMHSEMALFALYNIIDVALGRMMLALIRTGKTLPAPPEKKDEKNRNINSSIANPLTREKIIKHITERQSGKQCNEGIP